MNRRLAFVAGSVALCAGLALLLWPRFGGAAAGKPADEKNAPRITPSRIIHVTVYPDSALISREVEVPAGLGLMELVVNPLPEATLSSTLYSESADGVRVLTTRFRTRAVREDTREEVRKIEDELKALQAKQRRLQHEVLVLADSVQFMAQLEKYTSSSTLHATEKGKLDSDAAIALAKYLIDNKGDKAKKTFELKEQILDNQEALDFANRKMRELATGSNKIERDAVLVIDKANAAAGKVRLNYLVSGAAWKPQYKFRAGKDAKEQMRIEYLAGITQQTGEDWDRVGMTLSTAQPMLNATPPELLAMAVNVVPRGGAGTGVTVGGLHAGLGLPAGGGKGGGMGGPMPTVPGTRLALANPGESAKATELRSAAKLLRDQAQASVNLRKEKDALELNNYAAVLDQVCDLVVKSDDTKARFTATAGKNEGPSVTYHLAHKLSVPSRTDDQVIEVTKLEMAPEYFYKAVPVLTPHVYRQAEIVNSSANVLLPGEATM
ncbi:MAG: mucoidy inhibitor MuiA family protein, partial [Gemmataceae bacterium]|nr:mucoidy inhibitor MuiA family protein [Gemmataceae bacterium]